MMQDIRRICESPTPEDRKWFPDIAGSDWVKTLDFAMRNFKDESFISQYLSPRLIREFRFFAIADHQASPVLEVDRKSTRLNPVTNAQLVCRLLLENNKTTPITTPDLHTQNLSLPSSPIINPNL